MADSTQDRRIRWANTGPTPRPLTSASTGSILYPQVPIDITTKKREYSSKGPTKRMTSLPIQPDIEAPTPLTRGPIPTKYSKISRKTGLEINAEEYNSNTDPAPRFRHSAPVKGVKPILKRPAVEGSEESEEGSEESEEGSEEAEESEAEEGSEEAEEGSEEAEEGGEGEEEAEEGSEEAEEGEEAEEEEAEEESEEGSEGSNNAAAASNNAEDAYVPHIGDRIRIHSKKFGTTTGQIIYHSLELVRILPQETSDRAVEFPMESDSEGQWFSPDLGVTRVEVFERQTTPYYTDTLGARVGETLEFFDKDGGKVAEPGIVAEIQQSPTQDSLVLEDGRVIKFRGIGPKLPIVVIRVRTTFNSASLEPEGESNVAASTTEDEQEERLKELLLSLLPPPTVEFVPSAERTFPDSIQREDMYNDLMDTYSSKKQADRRIVNTVQREVDTAIALKNKCVMYGDNGSSIVGIAPYTIDTLEEALQHPISIAIPIVKGARVLHLDSFTQGETSYKTSDIAPRSIRSDQTWLKASQYESGTSGQDFHGYIYEMLQDTATLIGPAGPGWSKDRDVIRTAGPETAVEGLSAGLPKPSTNEDQILTLGSGLVPNVRDRTLRVLAETMQVHARNGQSTRIAPSDPSVVRGAVVLPAKAALALCPPTHVRDLQAALASAEVLQSDSHPTMSRTLFDLFHESPSPTHTWTWMKKQSEKQTRDESGGVSERKVPDEDAEVEEEAAENPVSLATWLREIIPFAVHPSNSLRPASSQMLALLDAMGLTRQSISPEVATVLREWVTASQDTWKELFHKRRGEVQASLDAVMPRTFQSVTDDGSAPTVWSVIKDAPDLQALVADIQARNPDIADAATLLVVSLIGEAQGYAAPLVWAAIATMDDRPHSLDTVAAKAHMKASRDFLIRTRLNSKYNLLQLHAEPVINSCSHVHELVALRATPVTERKELFTTFIETYQGAKMDNSWIQCNQCNEHLVCAHELLESEAWQPGQLESRIDAIQKQVLIQFGGGRYDGKVVCRNCGQGLQEIEFDDSVEFDDNGRPIIERSVLTEEQMAEADSGTMEKIFRHELIKDLVPTFNYSTPSQTYLGEILTTITNRGGFNVDIAVHYQIVRHADLYVTSKTMPEKVYNAQMDKLKQNPKTKIGSIPTYVTFMDRLRVSALTALMIVALQSAVPAITVQNAFPQCTFGRKGWPLDVDAERTLLDGTAIGYITCVVASIGTTQPPWKHQSWAGKEKLDARRTDVYKAAMVALGNMLGIGETSASFTPEILAALDTARTDLVAARARTLASVQDQIAPGFRPDPFPVSAPGKGAELDPLPKVEHALAAGRSNVGSLMETITDALGVQSIATVSRLHADATTQTASRFSFADAAAGKMKIQGGKRLATAQRLLQKAQPTTVRGGCHLWPAFVPPVSDPIPSATDSNLFFTLFIKYCYTGPRIGEPHEFSSGFKCRQCDFNLGAPIEFIHIVREGPGLLASQLGPLKIVVSEAEFIGLSNAIRRRRVLASTSVQTLSTDRGVGDVMEACGPNLTAITDIVKNIPISSGPHDDITRATLWAPLSTLHEELKNRVIAVKQKGCTAFQILETMLADPFVEGPRILQEYWCAKTEAAGRGWKVKNVKGSKWFRTMPSSHNERLNKLLTDNADWCDTEITDAMRGILLQMGRTLGPVMRAWIQTPPVQTDVFTVTEARLLLGALVLQVWRDAITTDSWMYTSISDTTRRETTAQQMSVWISKLLCVHVKEQFQRLSSEEIQRILQQRSEMERTSVVKEFDNLNDDDLREAERYKMRYGIGRWGIAASGFGGYNADLMEFEAGQREMMGVGDASVEQILAGGGVGGVGGAEPPPPPPEEYDVVQEAEDDA